MNVGSHRLVAVKAAAVACLVVICVLCALPERMEDSIAHTQQLFPLRGGIPTDDAEDARLPRDEYAERARQDRVGHRTDVRQAHRRLRAQRRHLGRRTTSSRYGAREEVRQPTMLEQRSQPVWERPVHLSSRQSAQLKLMANKMLAVRLHKKLESLQSDSESQELAGKRWMHSAHRLWRKARRFGADADVLLASARRSKLKAEQHITSLAQVQTTKLEDQDRLAGQQSQFADLVRKATDMKKEAEADDIKSRQAAIRAMQELKKAKEDVEAGIKGKQQIIDLNETIMEDKETLESSNSLKDATVRQVVKEGAEVRLAKEYNSLALAKYHVEHAKQYKQYGEQLYAQAKMDAAQSIKLKDSAKAKAVTAKDLFDSAGLSRLGLDEAQNQLATAVNQAKKAHDVTKQKLLLAQTHFKTGTKDKALFHYWATKSNGARSHAYEHLDQARRVRHKVAETQRRIQQLLTENADLEKVVRKGEE